MLLVGYVDLNVNFRYDNQFYQIRELKYFEMFVEIFRDKFTSKNLNHQAKAKITITLTNCKLKINKDKRSNI